jgi:hypothetical protein
MTIGFLFWILFAVAVVFYIFSIVQSSRTWDVFSVFLMVQMFLLGLQVFGWPIRRGSPPPEPRA